MNTNAVVTTVESLDGPLARTLAYICCCETGIACLGVHRWVWVMQRASGISDVLLLSSRRVRRIARLRSVSSGDQRVWVRVLNVALLSYLSLLVTPRRCFYRSSPFGRTNCCTPIPALSTREREEG
jgi:hypothetical protein